MNLEMPPARSSPKSRTVKRAQGGRLRSRPGGGALSAMSAVRSRSVHPRALGGNGEGDAPGRGEVGEPVVPEYHGASESARTDWPSSDQFRGERFRPSAALSRFRSKP